MRRADVPRQVGTIPSGPDAANHVFHSGGLPAYHEFGGTEHFEFDHPGPGPHGAFKRP